ncbi:hypothetical protein BZG02_20050 [Labilibaculum filiforme]|uniref:Glycosyltransferase 2-like domain-containing protein n=1 Tax=Labilibaculum filiforme TaxID=1940526 RepID=A0A2N3HQF5_9BACT|nr:glycosyltransferase [Labilibaculum filiforme]PKQ60294.1 hypothetical protein BZG02_20050 [Labilibaculum filiforme]
MTTSVINQKIVIGIYIDALSNVKDLFKTLFFISDNTSLEYEIILLIDSIKPELKREIRNTFDFKIKTGINLHGRTSLFNCLLDIAADYYLFVDCGMLVGSKALDQLVELMEKNRDIGIIGPSTNNSWSQQSLYKDAQPESVNWLERVEEIKQVNSLNFQELDSLLESFLFIRKNAIEIVGYADEKYADGYYWEVDYCVRIKKAGFKLIWAKGIYVHRLFAGDDNNRNKTSVANSNYFKEKFCVKFKLDSNPPNCDCCKGFLCESFVVDIKNNLKISERTESVKFPLVSCIMPTKNRAHFILQSINYFHAQDYPNKELIIVYDAITDLPDKLIENKNIHLFKSEDGDSIGKKRNMACENSSGIIIIHWDDDDWYSANRISRQVQPILENDCDITGLNNTLFYLNTSNEFWKCSEDLSKKMLVENVHGGSLAYNKSFWSKANNYPDTSLREDADFMLKMMRNGARLRRIDGKELFIYLRHGNNSWTFNTGLFLDPSGWEKVDTPDCILEDIAFYRSMPKEKKEICNTRNQNIPKVTCIMPTADRREFVPRAIEHYKNQLYKNKELIIIDDGTDKIEDAISKGDNDIKYVSLEKTTSIGEKRNIACALASGEIIIHWDDDDWMSPSWIQYQVNTLLEENADVTGLDQPFFFQPKTANLWQYNYPKSERPWVHGGTLCYTKKLWRRNPFKAINIGEDARFLWSNCPKKIVPHNNVEHYVGFIHDKNVSPKNTKDSRWHVIDNEITMRNVGGAHLFQFK